jgi:hypothetical protein
MFRPASSKDVGLTSQSALHAILMIANGLSEVHGALFFLARSGFYCGPMHVKAQQCVIGVAGSKNTDPFDRWFYYGGNSTGHICSTEAMSLAFSIDSPRCSPLLVATDLARRL